MNLTTNSNSSEIEELRARQQLYERLSRVHRSISHGAPLQEVLDAITAGTGELFPDEIVGLRLMDEDDPEFSVLVSVHGLSPQLEERLHRTKTGRGAGGLAIDENRLVVIQDYDRSPLALQPLAERGLNAAMAAPVHEKGEVAGSLVIASYRPERRYSDLEQEALLAFAQHASVALTDAKAVEAMREAQRSKEMFLAMVSHELKSPLTVIVGSLYTIRKHQTHLDAETLESIINNAHDRAKELGKLINRLLEGARAEIAVQAEEVVLADVIRDAIKGFDQAVSLVVGDVPEMLIRVDASAVQQILEILVENAVSHSTPETGVSVDVAVENSQVALSVRNAGRLPEGTDREALFVPFKRGDNVQSQGVGLGLYIASQLARAIGGRIDAESVDGWVEFCLRFPVITTRSTQPERVDVRR